MSEQQTLTEEFNTTTAAYMETGGTYRETVSLDMVLLKYTALQRYKLYEDPAKKEITETLYRCATDNIKRCSAVPASRDVGFPDDQTGKLKRIFDQILAEGQAANIPSTAPQELASLSLDMLRKMESLDPQRFLNYKKDVESDRIQSYRAHATALATFTLQYADTLRAALAEVAGNVTTSQPMTTSRVIQLKQPTGSDAP